MSLSRARGCNKQAGTEAGTANVNGRTVSVSLGAKDARFSRRKPKGWQMGTEEDKDRPSGSDAAMEYASASREFHEAVAIVADLLSKGETPTPEQVQRAHEARVRLENARRLLVSEWVRDF
jgi:hypothetical protein